MWKKKRVNWKGEGRRTKGEEKSLGGKRTKKEEQGREEGRMRPRERKTEKEVVGT